MIAGITAGVAVEGAPTLWTPAQITTQVWFDANDSSTVTIATGVSQWNDKSSHGRNVVQATALNQPGYNLVQLNSLPVLSFDGTDNLIGTTSLAGLAQNIGTLSYHAVRRFTNLGGGSFPTVFVIGDGDAPTTASARLAHYVSASDDHERPTGQRTDAQALANKDTGVISQNVWQIFSVHVSYSTAGITAFRDATSVLSTTFQDAGNTSNTAPNSISVGAWNEGSFDLPGNIAEIIVTHTIDTTQRQLIEGYLAWKWGLQASLPGGHPYLSAPPTL